MEYNEIIHLLEWRDPRPAEEVEPSPNWGNGWAEASVGTERMLKTLRKKGKGSKKWHSLMDKVCKVENLRSSFKRVKSNKGAAGIDRQSIEQYEADLEANLRYLSESLRSKTYSPKAIRRCWIPKPGSKNAKRPIGISTVRDRVVQGAIRNVIEPIFENEFAENSYGYRPQRSAKDALRNVRKEINAGKVFVLDADLQGFFDQIDHKKLMELVRELISDKAVLALIEGFLKGEIWDNGERQTPERGTPQGSLISPLLSNLFLTELDKLIAESGQTMIRYADDFVVLCDTAEACEEIEQLITNWCEQRGLTLHPEKTQRIEVNSKEGVTFLGYCLLQQYNYVSRKSSKSIRRKIQQHVKRTSGCSLQATIEKINPILRGIYQYYKHAEKLDHKRIDTWVRMRLRSILRKRNKLKGRGRGQDHKRWNNAYFEKLGLFSLLSAREQKA